MRFQKYLETPNLELVISEIGKQKVKLKIISDTEDDLFTRWSLPNGDEYEFAAYTIVGDPEWTINFALTTGKGSGISMSTGRGLDLKDVSAVIAGVRQSVELLVKKKNPKRIEFVAVDPKTRPLYDRLAKELSTKAGYKLKKSGSVYNLYKI